MVGSYQTITYNRYAVQSSTKFKAKIVDIPFCDPESGFSILVASRIEDGKSIVLKGIIPNPVENAYITYQGHWEQDARRGPQYVKVESCKIDYEAGGTDSIYELLTSGYVPGVGPVTAKKIIKAFGTDSLKIIEKSLEKLTELAGIKEKAAKKIHDAYFPGQSPPNHFCHACCSLRLSHESAGRKCAPCIPLLEGKRWP